MRSMYSCGGWGRRRAFMMPETYGEHLKKYRKVKRARLRLLARAGAYMIGSSCSTRRALQLPRCRKVIKGWVPDFIHLPKALLKEYVNVSSI